MKRVRAFALPTVIVISILICMLILFAISLYDFNNLYYSYYHRVKQQKEDINSIFVLYCNDSTLLKKSNKEGSFQLYDDRPQTFVSIKAKRWGLYECAEVHASDDSYSSIRLLGKAQDCEYEAALWVCNKDLPLSLGGEAEVKGKAYIPAIGIKYVGLGDLPFQGKEIKDYYIDLSERELPEVDRANLYLKDKYLKETKVIPLPGDSGYQAYYSFSGEETHFYIPDNIKQFTARGQVVLHGDEVALSAGTLLNDVILIARRVTVDEGFRGSLQIIATDTVILGKNSHLYYPSGVYLKGNNDRTYLKMDANSMLDGYAVIFGTTENNNGNDVEENFWQAPTAMFNGLLYVDGIAQLQGKCYGGAYLKECYYLSPDKGYDVTICNAKIYRNSQIGFPFFFKQSEYRRKEIKTLN